MSSTKITREILQLSSGKPLRCSFFIEDPNPSEPVPLILCLHPGWNGPTPEPHYGEGFLSSIFIPAFGETGALLAAPDCPAGAWNNPESQSAVLELIDHMIDEHKISPRQVALVGYSAGGWGAWYFLLEHAAKFVSAVLFATLPVIDPVDRLEENFAKCEELVNSRLDEWLGLVPEIPITMIQSRADELFNFQKAWLVYQTLLNANRPVQFTAVDAIGHFDGQGYIAPLQKTIPWLIKTWNPG